jgi:multiple sugar transport system permease protein
MGVSRPAPRTGGIALPAPLRRRWRDALGRDWATGWLFVAPTVLLLFGLIGYPFFRAVWLSFTNSVGLRVGGFVGLDNYVNLWTDDFFVRSVTVTATFTLVSVAFKFVFGLSAALLLHNIPRWRDLLTGLVLLPWIIPEVIRALAWRVLLDPLFGALNHILVNVLHLLPKGLPWLGDPATALSSVIMVNVWQGIPFFTVVLLAGLKAVDVELYAAAAVDGASSWRRFLHVTLPQLRYVIIVATLLSTIWTFNGFGLVYLLTGGGPGGATRIYSILAYEYAVQGLRYSAGASVALTMAPLLFILVLVLGRYMMRREETSDDEGGRVWKALMTVFWPIRIALRGLVMVFWRANDLVELGIDAFVRLLPRRAGSFRGQRAQRRVGYVVMYSLILALLTFELLPFYFIVITAFKSTLQIQQITSMFWPAPWTLDHFVFLFTEIPFALWYRNTVVVALASTVLSVAVSSLGAYALVRLRFRGAGAIGSTVLVSYLMPGALMFIPMYAILVALKLINNLGGLLVTYPSMVLPFATWLLMGYYRSIPQEMEDAAMIDGCNRLQTYFRIVLPLTAPALMAVALFAVTQSWNEFLYAYTFLRSEDTFTLPVGLAKLIIADIQPWGVLMAASMLTSIPVVFLYMLGQRMMVAGLTAGAVKG